MSSIINNLSSSGGGYCLKLISYEIKSNDYRYTISESGYSGVIAISTNNNTQYSISYIESITIDGVTISISSNFDAVMERFPEYVHDVVMYNTNSTVGTYCHLLYLPFSNSITITNVGCIGSNTAILYVKKYRYVPIE